MDIEVRLHPEQRRSHAMMKIPTPVSPSLSRARRLLLCICALTPLLPSHLQAQTSIQTTGPQQLAFTGLRTVAGQGQFNAIQSDSSGDLYLLLDQRDGIRLLKTDATATNLLAQAYLGAKGDVGLAMAFDPTGNIYITGTSSSGSLTGTSGSAFPAPADTSTNSFVAKFDANLNPIFLTFGGSGRMAAAAIAVTANAVYITGSIFAATLPVTPAGIIQSPASGSTQNGFVEKFDPTGSTLLYATYLSGQGGNTSPAAIAPDPAGNAYIAGYTETSGYPTIAAVVPAIIPATENATSGFLTKLNPTGSGILFSTFIPGQGISSIAYDPIAQNLLLSGSIALGQFPVSSVSMPLVDTTYQTLLRIPLDGSTVLSSILLAPGTQSFVTPDPSGTWANGSFTTPLLPLAPLATIGNSYALHVTAQNLIDQSARFGGIAATSLANAGAPVDFTSLATDPTGQPIFAGSIAPTTSASLLASQTFDAPLSNAPTAALPSALHDAVLAPGSCNGSQCAGTAAYLAKLNLTAAPSLSLSIDDSPNITLRNLGSASANNLQLTATGFTLSTNCPTTLPAAAECSIALTGGGPGTITAQAANATTQTATLPLTTAAPLAIVFSPKELDFGIQTTASTAITLTLTITNLSQQSQTFTSAIDSGIHAAASPFSEITSDCPTNGPVTTKLLAPNTTCHITLGLATSTASDGPVTADWSIGARDVLLTGYLQPTALNLSASEIDFGTQYTGGLHLARFLYLSNNSATAITHTPVALSATSPFTLTDLCPTQLAPHTVCQIQLNYQSSIVPSADSTTLTLDQGLTVLITGQTIPQPGVNGASVNPNLTVSPTTLNFPTPVIVTTTSGSTQTVTVSNTGNLPFTLTTSITPDFTETTNCPATVPGKSSCTVLVTFAPAQPGARQGLLSITAGAGTTPVYVNLSGTATDILASTNGTLDFGSVITGQPIVQWYKITQPFTQFTAATTGDFTALLVEDLGYGHGQPPGSAFTSTASGTCLNCWLGIQFQPSATGPRTGTLTLTSSGSPYMLGLTGIGLPLQGLTLTPATQDFGTIPLNSTSAPILFTLTNLTSSTTPITFSTPTSTGDFTIAANTSGGPSCTGTLAQNASCSLQIIFSPTATGPRTGTLTLPTSSGPATTTLTGFASADPGLSLNPTALIFNNTPNSAATQQTITLTNTGSTQLQIATPTTTLQNFQLTTTCSTLTPASTCTITVTFTPSTGPVTDTLTIPVGATNYTVSLTGTYTATNAGLQIIPNQADFGPAATGTVGVTRQFTLNNLTAKSLAVTIDLPRQFVLASPPCSSLAPNASCVFSVSFLPLTNADITGTLFAQAIPTDGSATLNGIGYLEGYGTGSATVAITGNLIPGNPLSFGQVNSGQTATQTLTLTNNSSATPLSIRRITSGWPFLANTTCGATLAYHQTCTVNLTYSPLNQIQTGSTGIPFNTDAGTLIIESDALTSPNIVNLSGQTTPILVATPANTAPLVAYIASQNSLTFPATPVGNISAPQTVVLSNTGTTVIHFAALQTTPDFTATSNCTALIPTATCTITATFTPTTTGTRISALEISSDSSTALEFLSLIGAASPSTLNLSPTFLDFSTIPLGNSSTLPIQITNNGTTPATFNSLTATGDYTVASGTCPPNGSPPPPAATCTLQLTFTPTQTGTRTGTLSVSTSASALPLIASLTGIGSQPHLQITPASLTFVTTALGSTTNLTLTLANTGNAPVSNIALSTTGDFAVTTPCAVTSLAARTSCSVTVSFTPTAAGARPGTLTISSSDPNSPATIPLTGTGVINGGFLLTVNGAPTAAASVARGAPANYTLTITPQNNFTGTVVLNCTPVTAASYAACLLLPSSITLSGGAAQTATTTITTVTSISQTKPTRTLPEILLCMLAPTIFILRRRRPTSGNKSATLLGIALLTATLLAVSGCGSGEPTLRYAISGDYQFQVTASSTTGTPYTQTVTLNLTIK